MSQAILPTQEQLKEQEAIVLQRYKLICQALDNAKVRWDDDSTMIALAEVLVRSCVALGVKKQQFMSVLKDTWRRATGDLQKQALLIKAMQAAEEGSNNEEQEKANS